MFQLEQRTLTAGWSKANLEGALEGRADGSAEGSAGTMEGDCVGSELGDIVGLYWVGTKEGSCVKPEDEVPTWDRRLLQTDHSNNRCLQSHGPYSLKWVYSRLTGNTVEPPGNCHQCHSLLDIIQEGACLWATFRRP
jgi:hypothetical protein